MKYVQLLLILTISLTSCTKPDTGIFKDLEDSKEVIIALSDYNLDSIPADIGRLKNAETLSVSQNKPGGWTVGPPLSALNAMIDRPPYKILPDEITELQNLRKLTIFALNIKTLPDDFGKLQNLEYLNLVDNKLIISNEIEKMKALKKLKYVYLVGNRIDTAQVERWQGEQPDLQIKFRADK